MASANVSGPAPTPIAENAIPRRDTMNIVTWNCNGLRSLSMKANHPLSTLFAAYDADIYCFQETKISSWSDVDDACGVVKGYESYWSFSRARKGYSGTVTYVREGMTKAAYEDLNDPRTDGEGRIVATDHVGFVLLNVYFPNGGRAERIPFKLAFYSAVESHARSLIAQGRHVILVGDVNTSHMELDCWSPKTVCKLTGFLPEERAWLYRVVRSDLQDPNAIVESTPTEEPTLEASTSLPETTAFAPDPSAPPFLIDSFRYFHPKERGYTFWDMRTQKREINFGWRIDYCFLDVDLALKCGADAQLHPKQRGSDHCPVSCHLRLPPASSSHIAAAASSTAITTTTPSNNLSVAGGDTTRLSRIYVLLQSLAPQQSAPINFPLPSSTSIPIAARSKSKFQKQDSIKNFFGGLMGKTNSNSSVTTSNKAAPPSLSPSPSPMESHDSTPATVRSEPPVKSDTIIVREDSDSGFVRSSSSASASATNANSNKKMCAASRKRKALEEATSATQSTPASALLRPPPAPPAALSNDLSPRKKSKPAPSSSNSPAPLGSRITDMFQRAAAK